MCDRVSETNGCMCDRVSKTNGCMCDRVSKFKASWRVPVANYPCSIFSLALRYSKPTYLGAACVKTRQNKIKISEERKPSDSQPLFRAIYLDGVPLADPQATAHDVFTECIYRMVPSFRMNQANLMLLQRDIIGFNGAFCVGVH